MGAFVYTRESIHESIHVILARLFSTFGAHESIRNRFNLFTSVHVNRVNRFRLSMTTKRFPRGGKYEGGCWHLPHISLLVVCSSSSKNNLFAFVLSSVAIMESQSPRPMPKLWTDGECRRFLVLMGSDDPDAGYFQKMKNKKISRARMMREIAKELTAEGIVVTQANCDNKWKALLTSYRTAEDHNSKSGNEPKKDPPFHAEMAKILGDRASTRPKALAGSNIPVPKCSAPLSVSLDSSSSSSTPTTPTTLL